MRGIETSRTTTKTKPISKISQAKPPPKPITKITNYNIKVQRTIQARRNIHKIFPHAGRAVLRILERPANNPEPPIQPSTTYTRADLLSFSHQQIKSTNVDTVTASTNNPHLNTLILPKTTVQQFLQAAKNNTDKGIETLAFLMGKRTGNTYQITHITIPKQTGTTENCSTHNEHELNYVQEQQNLITLGWIQTHPTQTAFLSSIDLHTQLRLQHDLPEAIAIVCSTRHHRTEYLTIIPGQAMTYMRACKLNGFNFHHHSTKFPLYQTATHLQDDPATKTQLIDLRIPNTYDTSQFGSL
jgi:STAM-binding protein